MENISNELIEHYKSGEAQEIMNAPLGNPNLTEAERGQMQTQVSLQGAEFKTKYKYIHFVEGLKDEWTVWTNKGNEYLGVITYHKKWKEWEFAPENYTGYTKQCLLDLADFIKQLKAPQSN